MCGYLGVDLTKQTEEGASARSVGGFPRELCGNLASVTWKIRLKYDTNCPRIHFRLSEGEKANSLHKALFFCFLCYFKVFRLFVVEIYMSGD